MGKSASGKDTIYGRVLNCRRLHLREIVPYTTRPPRAGETDGESYHFCTDEEADRMMRQGQVIEMRTYQTVYGPWRYFTADDGQIDLKAGSYLLIGTLEAYRQLCAYFGRDKVVALYIWTDDGVRLQRALDREKSQSEPKYAEMCRRFLADEADFSEEKLKEAQIKVRFENRTLQDTVQEICRYIEANA